VYDTVGGYNPRVYCSDASLWLSALAHGYQFTLVDKPLMHYRVRSTGRLARLAKHEHVPSLAVAFPELYKAHLHELLCLQEERFYGLLGGGRKQLTAIVIDRSGEPLHKSRDERRDHCVLASV